MGYSGVIYEKERWVTLYVHRLLETQQGRYQEQVSILEDRLLI